MRDHGGATSRLAWPRFPRVLNVLAPASTYFHGILHAVQATGHPVASVTVLHADSGFTRDVASGALAVGAELGYEVTLQAFQPGAAAGAARTASPADVVHGRPALPVRVPDEPRRRRRRSVAAFCRVVTGEDRR